MVERRLAIALLACFAAWVIATITPTPAPREKCVEVSYTDEDGNFVCECCERKDAAKKRELELQKEREAYEIRGDER